MKHARIKSRHSKHSPVNGRRKVRYAVVAAGHIAQNAVLPAFANAKRNSGLTAIVSDDARKRAALGRMYGVEAFDYGRYNEMCRADLFDAAYIALPNSMHCDFTCRSAAAGIHVLCEKPMAVTAEECERMIAATGAAGVRLMIAYRLHFEKANLKAVELAQRGRLGELRFFNSVFSMQVRPGNIRLDADLGGGPLYDLGVYCINAARYLFRAEPLEVLAFQSQGKDPRFAEVEEAVSAVLRFPDERLASFTCSFGAADAAHFQLLGAKGDLRVDPAYEYEGTLRHRVKTGGRTRESEFPRRDQFAAELLYFSDCVLRGRDPEPGGVDGLIDVRIIEALRESIRSRTAVALERMRHDPAPRPSQEIHRPPPRKKKLVKVQSAHVD